MQGHMYKRHVPAGYTTHVPLSFREKIRVNYMYTDQRFRFKCMMVGVCIQIMLYNNKNWSSDNAKENAYTFKGGLTVNPFNIRSKIGVYSERK